MKNGKNLTEEEKKEKQKSFKTWLEENNISMEFFQMKEKGFRK